MPKHRKGPKQSMPPVTSEGVADVAQGTRKYNRPNEPAR